MPILGWPMPKAKADVSLIDSFNYCLLRGLGVRTIPFSNRWARTDVSSNKGTLTISTASILAGNPVSCAIYVIEHSSADVCSSIKIGSTFTTPIPEVDKSATSSLDRPNPFRSVEGSASALAWLTRSHCGITHQHERYSCHYDNDLYRDNIDPRCADPWQKKIRRLSEMLTSSGHNMKISELTQVQSSPSLVQKDGKHQTRRSVCQYRNPIHVHNLQVRCNGRPPPRGFAGH